MHTVLTGKFLTLASLVAAALLAAPPAWAGCGCDRPPPSWTVVMPPFGSPGREITVYADGFEFVPGSDYEVDFAGNGRTVTASHADHVLVSLPKGVEPGPVAIKLLGEGVDVTYSDALFTALPKPRSIKDKSGVFAARDYEAAIGSDGTLYLALDVGKILDAMQFTFAIHELPLAFGADDVVIYNADGVDLTLFTLAVDDPTLREWGSYYGWTVESDANLPNTFYLPKVGATELNELSSLFTYWRHDFYTYAAAHESGGTHEVDANGFHPDGTRHIDHSRLVVAIQGVERDATDPSDLSLAMPLAPGKRVVNVGWVSLETAEPVELADFNPLISASDAPDVEDLLEVVDE